MEQEDIIEGNVLIAEFLGYKWPSSDIYTEDEVNHLKRYEISEMRFHSSWNHLMPVVEKIETDDNYEVIINKDRCSIFYESSECVNDFKSETKIKAVWLCVVEFIKWYNQNTG